MSQHVTQNQSNASTIPSLTEITALISALQETTQALLKHSQVCKANEEGASKGFILCESKDTAMLPKPKLSKRAQSRECYKEFSYNHRDCTAFADKDISSNF